MTRKRCAKDCRTPEQQAEHEAAFRRGMRRCGLTEGQIDELAARFARLPVLEEV